MKRMAFYGGSFDPPHNGHLTIAERMIERFRLDRFVFVPAFHAPHKKDKKPTSAFHRYAMLSLATGDKEKMSVSKIELDQPEKPYTVETQARLKRKFRGAEIFFVIGADSWAEITTWREWERVLTQTNIIVVTRPGSEIEFAHVTEKIRKHIVDLRESRESKVDGQESKTKNQKPKTKNQKIYFTDAVNLDVSSTEIRRRIRAKENDWNELVPRAAAKYIEKYALYI